MFCQKQILKKSVLFGFNSSENMSSSMIRVINQPKFSISRHNIVFETLGLQISGESVYTDKLNRCCICAKHASEQKHVLTKVRLAEVPDTVTAYNAC